MKYLLDPDGRAALQAHLGHSTLIALDYDGTLAPIVEDRRRAVMADTTRQLLRQIAHRRPTVIISGRARAEVRSFLTGIELLEIIGNHGIEADGVHLARFAGQVREWHAELDERLETLPGLAIEDKRYSLAVHYRQCGDKHAARALVLRAIDHLEDVRIVGGKDVLNVLPVAAPDKGQALLTVMARHDYRRAIFVGDDDTDEDVFALKRPEQIMTIRVGVSPASAADYYLNDRDDMDAFLSILNTQVGVVESVVPLWGSAR